MERREDDIVGCSDLDSSCLAGTGSVRGRCGFSYFCQTAARGSCMVRAAHVRAQTHTSTDPPNSNYFCRPPLSWGPAGRRSIVSLYIDRARVVRTEQGVVKSGLGGSH